MLASHVDFLSIGDDPDMVTMNQVGSTGGSWFLTRTYNKIELDF